MSGPSGAWAGFRCPSSGFETVDLMADAEEEEEMDATPATPSPIVSDDEMATDEEKDLLAYHEMDHQDSSSDEDGFQHV